MELLTDFYALFLSHHLLQHICINKRQLWKRGALRMKFKFNNSEAMLYEYIDQLFDEYIKAEQIDEM